MLNKLLEWDKKIFVYLNNLGIEEYDTFWTVATEIISWTPLFILFFVLILLAFPKKEGIYKSLTVLVLLLFVLLLTDITKDFVERLRPNNNDQLKDLIRILRKPSSFSFYSGHAASSFSITTLVVLFLRRKIKWTWLFYLWPLIFSFSRIYVGVHYPFDIITGTIVGVLLAFLFYKIYGRFIEPYSGSAHP
ncbi:MAG: phosphatase PAP2 family protein [Flavobacteriaceae bacterium]